MLPDDRDLAALWDIHRACSLAQQFVQEQDREAFVQDAMCHFAVIAQIQIIGEATKRLSDAFREVHPDIPWAEMAGMRDVLIHLYDKVDLDEVWLVVTRDIPYLLSKLEVLLPDKDGRPEEQE